MNMTPGFLDQDKPRIFVGRKAVKARPMTRGEYNAYRGWALPADENGADPGYLVEYLDGGKPNHENHAGYISWSPGDVFERSYTETCASGDEEAWLLAMHAEMAELEGRLANLDALLARPRPEAITPVQWDLLDSQRAAMNQYLTVLGLRFEAAAA